MIDRTRLSQKTTIGKSLPAVALALGALGLAGAACTVTVRAETRTTHHDDDPPPRQTAKATAKPAETSEPTSKPTATASSDPGPVCTKIGCADTLKIGLTWGKALQKGTYAFTVEADGKKAVCEAVVPLAKDSTIKCNGDLVISIDQQGAGEPIEKQAIGPIMFLRFAPREVKVDVTLNKKPFASTRETPNYEVNAPNGPNCPPTCKRGEVTIKI
ncbi:MAG: hypothetical protein U0271_13975 [Polyangiaceae bacterium]